MSTCRLEFVRELPDGKYLHRCPKCKAEVESRYRDPAMRAQTCGKTPPGSREEKILRQMPEPERIEREAAARGRLAGDVIADMLKEVGFPPCSGCEARRQWLNKAHQWCREWLAS